MIDLNKVKAEFGALGANESKEALASFLAENDISVKLDKRSSFDNQLLQLSGELMTMDIEFVDLKKTRSKKAKSRTTTKPAPKTTAKPVLDAPVTPVDEIKPSIDTNTPVLEQTASESPVIEEILAYEVAKMSTPVMLAPVASTETLQTTQEKPFESDDNAEGKYTPLPPTVPLIGPGRGYMLLQWWFYDWIVATGVGWQEKIAECTHANAQAVLNSLAYYIVRDGSVTVRESRNSRFVVLA